MNKEKIEKPDLTIYRMVKAQQFQKGGALPKGLKFGGSKNKSSTKESVEKVYAKQDANIAKAAKKKKSIAKKVANTYLPKGDATPNKTGARFKKKQVLQQGGLVKETPYKAQDGTTLKNDAIKRRRAAEMAKSKAAWGTDYSARKATGKAAAIKSGIEYKNERNQDSIGAANRNMRLKNHVQKHGVSSSPLAVGQAGPLKQTVTPSGNRGNMYKTSVKYRK